MNSSESHKKMGIQFWSQLAIAAVGMVVTVLGINNSKYSWLLYVGVIIIFVSLVVIVSDSVIARFILKKIHERNIRKILRTYEREYMALIGNLVEMNDLMQEIERIKWMSNRPPCGHNYSNSVYDLNNRLPQIPKGIKILFVNSLIKEIVSIGEDFLYACDNILRSGAVKFESEQHMKKVKKALSKYENFLNRHNSLCKQINSDVEFFAMHELYGHDLVFEWNDAHPDS